MVHYHFDNCLEAPNSAPRRMHSQETRDKISAAVQLRLLEILICPHCGTQGNAIGMKSSHFDYCSDGPCPKKKNNTRSKRPNERFS